ncbi:uncharacterized protein cubi_00885 [Cryptosporidium ubiquitum]|uniref:Uncharacterized protein n=1 Tax=Cryptosporidium ubiquitum TaxID=857276 RepID=A0A1J4MCJ1_9CRYT|nr:uncharacterized protein cubi_00885 [Cryptosporidium ubiquitum]OII70740.1 hypothetical protein cubi_00885 [Cryptosporidium ubiquitum]
MGYNFIQNNDTIFTLLFNETYLTIKDWKGQQEYYSPYTNEKLAYNNMNFTIGIGLSRLGLYIMNSKLQSLIQIQPQYDYSYNHVKQLYNNQVISNYLLEDGFFYPNTLLYEGYQKCSLYNNCLTEQLECYSQVLTGICQTLSPGLHLKFETEIKTTYLNNGTWGEIFQQSDLLNTYIISSNNQDQYIVYIYHNRIAIQDINNYISCSGPYPNGNLINIKSNLIWEIGFDSYYSIFLNVYDQNDNQYYSICQLKAANQKSLNLIANTNPELIITSTFGIESIDYIYTRGYNPSNTKFTQYINHFPRGGYKSSSSNSNLITSYYYPYYDQSINEYNPLHNYGENYPFFPPGIKPAPIIGNYHTTPPGYYYNKTTSQFEKNPDHPNPNELNPFQPNHIVDGISECNLYLFSTCNGTSAKIMPIDYNLISIEEWTLFVILTTGIPNYDQNNNYSGFNYKYEFIKYNDITKDEEIILSLSLTNETVTFKNHLIDIEKTVSAPQCGPYCSTYPKGFFAFWLTYDKNNDLYEISINSNSELLITLPGSKQNINKIITQSGINSNNPSYNIWYITNVKKTPKLISTTTTTISPWDKIQQEVCNITEIWIPCKGFNATINPNFNLGDLISMEFILEKECNCNNKINHLGNQYWLGFDLNDDYNKIFSIFINESSIIMYDWKSHQEYISPFTNESLSYDQMNLEILIGWSRLGIFLMDKNHNGLIHIQNLPEDQINKIKQYSDEQNTLVKFELISREFLYPNEILYQGYHTCSFYNDCNTEIMSCSSQALIDTCNKPRPGMSWIIDTEISETNVNNGTWGSKLEFPTLINVFKINNLTDNIYSIYIFNNRISIQDEHNKISCDGYYPGLVDIKIGDHLKWSIGIDHSYLLYLNIHDIKNGNKNYTVCVLPMDISSGTLSSIYPKGYSPLKSTFIQQISGFPKGGYEKSNPIGFYDANYNSSLGIFEPDKLYKKINSFFPVGINAAPTFGDYQNTPPGYFYNTTSSLFETEDLTLKDEINPYQPREFIKGLNECNIELLSVCNSSNINFRSNNSNLIFGKDWTLFVMISTGIPIGNNILSNLDFNYKYNFINDINGEEEVILSLTLRNESVIFKNEKTGDASISGSPQCGPYCSTYPKGFFTFWLTYNNESKKYLISVNSNKEHLVEVSGYKSVFNKIRGELGSNNGNVYSLWQLTNIVEVPVSISTTTTTTTSPPWDSITFDNCDIEIGTPCKGYAGTIQNNLKMSNVIWISTIVHNGNIILPSSGEKYWFGISLNSISSDNLMNLFFNETFIILIDYVQGKQYFSRYTDEILIYEGLELTFGLAWSKFGVFLLNENGNSLISFQTNQEYAISKIIPLRGSRRQVYHFLLSGGFLFPGNTLYEGYSTCSLYKDCDSTSTGCSAQTLTNPCGKPQPGVSWIIETEILDTKVNNGTWGSDLELSNLLNIYFVNNGVEDVLAIYLFDNRLALQDLKKNVVCNGPYPQDLSQNFGSSINWTLSIDETEMLYLNIKQKDEIFSVCAISFGNHLIPIVYIYPRGHAPATSNFTQILNSIPIGGFEPTSKNSKSGFYRPILNTTSGTYNNELYNSTTPFLPVGINPVPYYGTAENTPIGYHYNRTTNQFVRNPNNTNVDEFNPFRPPYIMNGVLECDLFIFDTCNGTSARIMPENTIFKQGWTLFTLISTGIPTRDPNTNSQDPNLRFDFINSELGGNTEETVLSLNLFNETVILRNERTGDSSIAGSPQCGPFCSTYPDGFFAFWLTYDPEINVYTVSVDYNKQKLVSINSANMKFNLIRPSCGNSQTNCGIVYNIFQLTNKQIIPRSISTTTTTTTAIPWSSQVLDECKLIVDVPCRGINGVSVTPFSQGNILWFNTTITSSKDKIHGLDFSSLHWFGYQFLLDSNPIFSLLFNETSITLTDQIAKIEYSSRYTNESLAYPEMNIIFAIGWSRLGLFVINSKSEGLIQINSLTDISFNKVSLYGSEATPSNFLLTDQFVFPKQILYKGYESCSFFEDCPTEASCSSQVLTGICNKKNPGSYYQVDTVITETFLTNSTWGSRLELSSLLAEFVINEGNSQEDLLSIYIFENRLAIQDLKHNVVCSGPYPSDSIIDYGDSLSWSIGFDDSNQMYLNVQNFKGMGNFTICTLSTGIQNSDFLYLYPQGYAPGPSVFKEFKMGFPKGGFESSVSNSSLNGYYKPLYNTSSQEYDPEATYGINHPHFPPGIQAAPLNGSLINTPSGYYYNTATGLFEKYPNNTNIEINPFQPKELLEGLPECSLHMFDICNSTSVFLKPKDTFFKQGWTLFVMLNNGIPSNVSEKYDFNYKYEFLNSKQGNKVVLSLYYNNETVVFRNEVSGEFSVAGSPQCGPYCSTYPKGFFTFWLSYDHSSNNYIISVSSNQKYLLHLDAHGAIFDHIKPCCESETANSFSLWQLSNTVIYPLRMSSTTTTLPPWFETVHDECSLSSIDSSQPCKGHSATLMDGNFSDSYLLSLNFTLSKVLVNGANNVLTPIIPTSTSKRMNLDNSTNATEDLKYIWNGFEFKDKNDQLVLSLKFNETTITLYDHREDLEYISPYTNESTVYSGKLESLSLGWSRLGLFLMNSDFNSLIKIPARNNFEFSKVSKSLQDNIPLNFTLQTNFMYPNEILYQGYHSCSLFNDCHSKPISCESQVLSETCNRNPSRPQWIVETEISDTQVNNGTWGPNFELPGLLHAFNINNGIEDIVSVYIFDQRIAIQSHLGHSFCDGLYPESRSLIIGDSVVWSVAVDDNEILYLNVMNENKTKFYSVCTLKYHEDFIHFKYIYPRGYSPSRSIFTQIIGDFPNGGFESSNPRDNIGFYRPELNNETGLYEPEKKYNFSFPFFPVGIIPAPISGNYHNTPPGYYYNQTSGLFVKYPNNTSDQVNPYQFQELSPGIKECDLYILSICNSTIVNLKPTGTLFQSGWTLFASINTGIPESDQSSSVLPNSTLPFVYNNGVTSFSSQNSATYNYGFQFINTFTSKIVLSINLYDEFTEIKNEITGERAVSVSPQCGPLCSTYKKGYFTFWMNYDAFSEEMTISIDKNKQILLRLKNSQAVSSFDRIQPCCSNSVMSSFSLWQLSNIAKVPQIETTTTTTTTIPPWQDNIQDECLLEKDIPCKGFNATLIDPIFNHGNVLWLSFKLPIQNCNAPFNLNEIFWYGYLFSNKDRPVLSILFNETLITLYDWKNDQEFYSPYKDGSLVFQGKNLNLGLGWSRLGFFLLNENSESLINIKSMTDFSFDKISNHGKTPDPSVFLLQTGFLYPQQVLLQGYKDCSFYNDCFSKSLSCSGQVLSQICSNPIPGMSWEIETEITNTQVNNGTWGRRFQSPDIINVFVLSPTEDLIFSINSNSNENNYQDYGYIYVLKDRVALQSHYGSVCSGPLPGARKLNIGDKLKLSLGIDSLSMLYLNIFNDDDSEYNTVCSIGEIENGWRFRYIFPMGNSPPISNFTQFKLGFPDGGFKPTYTGPDSLYDPSFDNTTGTYHPELKYLKSYPYFPSSIIPAPTDGNETNTPPGYFYNRTSSLFEKEGGIQNSDINPYRPEYIKNGVDVCDLSLFSVCNSTNVYLKPENTLFNSDWTLMVMMSTGNPETQESPSNNLKQNYKYEFFNSNTKSLILSITYSDLFVSLTNEQNGITVYSSSPQCGPFCSTYTNGFFTFWVTYSKEKNSYTITVNRNTERLLFLNGIDNSFNQIIGKSFGSKKSYTLWYLVNISIDPIGLSTTTTTSTSTTTTSTPNTNITSTSTTTLPPDLTEGCNLKIGTACTGVFGYFEKTDDSVWKEGVYVTISFKFPKIVKKRFTYYVDSSLRTLSSQTVFSLILINRDLNVGSILFEPNKLTAVLNETSISTQYSNGRIFNEGDDMEITLLKINGLFYIMDSNGFALIEYPNLLLSEDEINSKLNYTFTEIYPSTPVRLIFSVQNYQGYPFVLLNGYLHSSLTNYCGVDQTSIVNQAVNGLCNYPQKGMEWKIYTKATDNKLNSGYYGDLYDNDDLISAYNINNGTHNTLGFLFYRKFALLINLITNEQCSGVHPNSEELGFGKDHDWSIGFNGNSIFLNEHQFSDYSKKFTICTLPLNNKILPFKYLIPVGENPYSKMKVSQLGKGFPENGYSTTEKDNEIPINGVLMVQALITNFDYFVQKQIADERFKEFKDLFISSIKTSFGPYKRNVGIISLTPRNVQVSKVGNSVLQTATGDILVTFYIYSNVGQKMADFSLEISSKIIFNPTSIFGQIFEWKQLNFLTKDASPPIELIVNNTSCMGINKGKTALESIVYKYGFYSDLVTEYPPESLIGYFSFNHIVPNVPTFNDHKEFVLSFKKALGELLGIDYKLIGVIAVGDTPVENGVLGYGVIKFYISSNSMEFSSIILEQLSLRLSNPKNPFSKKMSWKQIEIGYCNKPKFYMYYHNRMNNRRFKHYLESNGNLNVEDNPFYTYLKDDDNFSDPYEYDYNDNSETDSDGLDEFINSFGRHNK